jgi:hypothetical protein
MKKYTAQYTVLLSSSNDFMSQPKPGLLDVESDSREDAIERAKEMILAEYSSGSWKYAYTITILSIVVSPWFE